MQFHEHSPSEKKGLFRFLPSAVQGAFDRMRGSERGAEERKLSQKGEAVEQELEELERIAAQMSDPLVRAKLKGEERSVRSFLQGHLTAVNLSMEPVNFYDAKEPENPWRMATPSFRGTVVRADHLIAVQSVVDSLDDITLRFLRAASIRGRLLFAFVSNDRGLALEEFGAFHDTLKIRSGIDSSEAKLLKLYRGKRRDVVTPKFAIKINMASKELENIDTQDSSPVLLVNLGVDTLYYLRVFSETTQDRSIDSPFVGEVPKDAETFRGELRMALSRFLEREDTYYNRLSKMAEESGTIVTFLPSNPEFRAIALESFEHVLKLTKLDFSRCRGVSCFYPEDGSST
ncbi:MAG: hypothetical protein KDD64_05740 [Bdellovibrionales bacterium]|nr:hypothetical protein [Bdellovibrionales bacterium]